MKNKKLFGVIATLALLASCGATPTQTPTETPTGGNTGDKPAEGGLIDTPVKITFWNTKGAPYSDVIEGAIETFKEIEPNITVENVKQSVGIGQMQDVVTKGFTSGVYPDIVEGYPDHISTYIDYDKVVQLDPLMEDKKFGWTEEERSQYVEAYIEEGQQYLLDGTYSVPFSKSTEILLYNKTLLDNIDLSGIDPSINGGRKLNEDYFMHLTWEEFFGKLCPALLAWNELQADDEKILDTTLPEYAVMGYDSDDNLAITLSQQYGMPYTSLDRENFKGEALFNTPEMVNKIAEMQDMASKHYLITQGGLGTYTNSLLETRGVLFVVSSTGGLSHCTLKGNEMGAGFIPQPESGAKKVISQGPSICLLKHEGPEEELRAKASWLFYKHLTNKQNGLAWALNGGYSPIRKDVLSDPAYVRKMDPDTAGETDSLPHLIAVANTVISGFSDMFYTTPAFKGSADCRTQLGGVMGKAIGAAVSGKLLTKDQIASELNDAWSRATLAINK